MFSRRYLMISRNMSDFSSNGNLTHPKVITQQHGQAIKPIFEILTLHAVLTDLSECYIVKNHIAIHPPAVANFLALQNRIIDARGFDLLI